VHLDEERLQRLLDGELARDDEARARTHLAGCDECSGRFAAMAREEERVGTLLRTLDRPAPRLDVTAIARRAEAPRPRIARWAASIALVLGLAGAAYALPGSPLPRWVDAVVHWASGRQNPLAPPATPAPPRSSAGVAVSPGRSLLVLFTAPNPRGQVVVTLTAGTEVEIRAPQDAATFTSGEERLVVEDHGLEATYEVDVPLAAPRVEIRVGERRIFLKAGGRVATATSGSSSPYRLSMAVPTP